MMPGASARRNGLQANSSDSREGTVGWFAERALRTCSKRASNALLCGSTVNAKAQLAIVYSWPQQMRV